MKYIDLKSQYISLKEEIDAGIQGVLQHGQYIMGPEVYELEKKLSEFTGSKHCLSCSSGTDALLIALMSLGLKSGDYVITTPFTYIATAEAISLLGGIPEFVDIDESTFNIDANQVEDLLRKYPNKYKAIMPVDIFGLLADYKSLREISNKYDIRIIEDAAQSFGASQRGEMSCSFGDISCTSFYPAKPLGCYGDGGAVFTNDDDLKDIIKSIREHGSGVDKYNNIRLGLNGRLDSIQAAVLIPKLKILDKEIAQRNKFSDYYSERLSDKFKVQHIDNENTSAWAQYSILCNSTDHRDNIIKKLNKNKIPTSIFYIKPLHLQEVFKNLKYNAGDFKISEKISEKILCLPMHPYLKFEDIDKICDLIMETT